jgi:hypothetical protein
VICALDFLAPTPVPKSTINLRAGSRACGNGSAAMDLSNQLRSRSTARLAFQAEMEDAAKIDRRDRAGADRDAGDIDAAQRNALTG